MLVRYSRKQAFDIVKNCCSAVEHRELLTEDSPVGMQDAKSEPKGHTQVKCKYPKVTPPVTLENRRDFTTQRLSLKSHKHLNQVTLFLWERDRRVPMAVQNNGDCLFESVMRGLELPEDYHVRHFRRELAVFCARNVEIFWRQHSFLLRRKSVSNAYSVRSFLYHIIRGDTEFDWTESICIDMISRMWNIRITVVDHGSEDNIWERRYRHDLEMKDTDVVLLNDGKKSYNAAVKKKFILRDGPPCETDEGIPAELKDEVTVVPKGLKVDCVEDAPDRDSDDLSVVDEEEVNPIFSDECYKSWKAHLQERPSLKRRYVSIPEDYYRDLVTEYWRKWGRPPPDTTDLVCGVCTEKFTSSRELQYHWRRQHYRDLLHVDQENSVQQESVPESTHDDDIIQLLDGERVQQHDDGESAQQADGNSVQQLEDNSVQQQEDNSVQPLENNSVQQQEDNSVQQLENNSVPKDVSRMQSGAQPTAPQPVKLTSSSGTTFTLKLIPDRFTCNSCGQICKLKASLKRHMEEKHQADKPLQCKYCKKDVKYKRAKEWHDNYCSKKLNCKNWKCDISGCGGEYYTKSTLNQHKKKKHSQ